MRTKEEYLKVLNETIEHYSPDPLKLRSTSGISCVYRTSDGRMCAVGRCLDQDVMDYDEYNYKCTVIRLVNNLGEDIFKEKYRGFSLDFWTDLQCLHDTSDNWDFTNNGLSWQGRRFVRDIEDSINNDKY